MHRSRLSTLLIDVPSDLASDAAAFWSAALGVPANPALGEEQFTSLPGAFPGLVTAIQAVDDEPRYHVDIETDDVAAETTRLIALGAVEVRRCHRARPRHSGNLVRLLQLIYSETR